MTDNYVTLKAFLRQMIDATAPDYPVWSSIATDALDALESQQAKITEALARAEAAEAEVERLKLIHVGTGKLALSAVFLADVMDDDESVQAVRTEYLRPFIERAEAAEASVLASKASYEAEIASLTTQRDTARATSIEWETAWSAMEAERDALQARITEALAYLDGHWLAPFRPGDNGWELRRILSAPRCSHRDGEPRTEMTEHAHGPRVIACVGCGEERWCGLGACRRCGAVTPCPTETKENDR